MRRSRKRLERIRNQPLEPVAAALGYRQDPTDPRRWKRPGSVLSIRGVKFYDHLRQAGRGGAIDLVIHARRCRFADAVEFLEAEFPNENAATPEDEPGEPDPIRIPTHCDHAWFAVYDFLVCVRHLPRTLLDVARGRDVLRADARDNAVFLCSDAAGTRTGAEIVGTRPDRPWRGMAPGSRKARGGFWMRSSARPPHTVILTESAIDAISLLHLKSPPNPETAVVSTAGATAALPEWIDAWNPKRILCAFDADATGDELARRLCRSDNRIQRLRPPEHKDWNEILQKSPFLRIPAPTEPR